MIKMNKIYYENQYIREFNTDIINIQKRDDKYLVDRANNQNKSQLTYLFTTSKIDDIIYFSDSVYFVDGEFIKRYSDKQGVRNIISYSELKFNDNLYFYVYKK